MVERAWGRATYVGVMLAAVCLVSRPVGAEVVPLPPTQPGDDAAVESYRDGPWQVIAQRRQVPLPPPLTAVTLVYPEVGASTEAAIDQHAIVQVAPAWRHEPDALWNRYALLPVRPLMPSVGLWLVADAGGADGLALAARLAPLLGDGSGLTGATPDLWLPHRRAAAPPDDPRFSGQWYLDTLDMLSAWELETGDAATTVVVVDNGCDLTHPDLQSKLDPGRDVVSGDDDPGYFPGEPGNEHGTACAGIIGAATNNGVGIAGTCPECRLRCVRLLGADIELVPESADVDAFQFAFDVDADVVSNSWGFVESIPVPSALADAINNVFDNGRGGRGALVIFAAGNDSHEIRDYELLAVRGVLGIGAINNYDEKTSFTNWGDSVDLVAPVGTVTTDIAGAEGAEAGDYFNGFGGTSSACPVAAGVAALLVSAAPELTAAEHYAAMVGSARPAPYAEVPGGHDPYFGWGIIDPPKALRRVLGLPEPGSKEPDEGCGCESTPAAGPWALVVSGLALSALRRRQRRWHS